MTRFIRFLKDAIAIVRTAAPSSMFVDTPTRMLSLLFRALALLTPRRCRAAAISFFVLMVAIGAVPGNAQALSATVHDKYLHFLAYALLSALLYGGVAAGSSMRGLCTVVAAGTLGAIDEAIQALLPYREAALADWQVDMLAALFCVALITLLAPLYSLFAARTAVPDNAGMQAMRPERRERS